MDLASSRQDTQIFAPSAWELGMLDPTEALGAFHTTINDTWAAAIGKQWEDNEWYWTVLQYTSLLGLLAFCFLQPGVLPALSHLDDPFEEKKRSPTKSSPRKASDKPQRTPTPTIRFRPESQNTTPGEKPLAALVKERRKRRFYGVDLVHVNLNLHGSWLTIQPTTPGQNRVMNVKKIKQQNLLSCSSSKEWSFDYEDEAFVFEMNDPKEVEKWELALAESRNYKTPKAGSQAKSKPTKRQPSPTSADDLAALAAANGGSAAKKSAAAPDLSSMPESGPPLTPAQEAKRTKLETMLFGDGITKRVTAPKGSEYKQETLEMMAGKGNVRKAFLRRFLRARQFDVTKTHEMLCASAHWRETFMGGVEPRPPPIDRASVDGIRKCIPHDWLGFSKDGHLVYIERSGGMDVPGLRALLQKPDGSEDPAKLLHYHVMVMDYQLKVLFPEETARRGRIVDKVIVINDLEGLGAQHVSSTVLGFLKAMSRVDQDNFCELLHKMYVVNAPWIFSVAWRIIKTFLEKRVQEKIIIISGDADAQNILNDEIGADSVPKFLGGSYDCEGPCTCTASGHVTPKQREFDRYYEVPGWEKHVSAMKGRGKAGWGAGAGSGAKETMATAAGMLPGEMLVVDTSDSPPPAKRTLVMDCSTPRSTAAERASQAFVKQQFEAAASFVKAWKPQQGQPGASEKLQCYSLYKQATQGNVQGSRPGMLDFANQAKWDAWSECKGCRQEDAMRSYVHVIEAQVAKYDSENSDFAKIMAVKDPFDQGGRGRSLTQEMELI
jgi:acyl-CoA-binding protein